MALYCCWFEQRAERASGNADVDMAAWLRGLGLERYEAAFRENDIAPTVLPELTDQDLKELGVSLGHRRLLLKAIRALGIQADHGPGIARPKPAEPVAQSGAERRQLTVVFIDLVGSTELSARLDPEDMGQVIHVFQQCCARVVTRWEGHIAKYIGDGVLAFFGFPRAHEDDAERAVRAGLELTAAVARLSTGDGTPLAARVGIATGLVMVGASVDTGAAHEDAVIGGPPNLAARLQAVAAPGGVVISQATRRLIGALFELADLGPQYLKGFADPVVAWRVEGEGRAEGLFAALRGHHLTPLVGRQDELGMLLERWGWAKQGDGQVVLLSGEPGIGKSRIVRALRERLAGEPHVALSHFSSPHHTNSALHVVIGQLQRAARFAPEDTPETRLIKLEELLAKTAEGSDEALPLIAALLDIPTGDACAPLDLTPQRRRQRTLEVLIDLLAALTRERPVLELYEDVHWADPTTLELLDLLIERVGTLPVLVLITFRPEFGVRWVGQKHVTHLALERLDPRQSAALVERVAGGERLPVELVDTIVVRADGVPLFIEELTKTVLESGLLHDAGDRHELPSPLPPLAVPATLHDSLMARLDRLPSARQVAQIGAVIGREFSYELLAAATEWPEAELRSALDHLEAAELVSSGSGPPGDRYSFKHALVRDAAYESILKSRRRILHGRIAALLERSPATAPDLLAQHLAGAGMAAAAARAYARDAQTNIARGAGKEAIAQLAVAIRLLEDEPKDDERGRLEAELLVARGDALRLVQGTAAPETGAVYRRARELSEQLGARRHRGRVALPALSKAFYGECLYHYHRAELREAHALALRLLETSTQDGDATSRELGLEMAALTSFSLGALVSARGYFDQFAAPLKSDDPPEPVVSRRPSGSDIYLACTLLLLGYPTQARKRTESALAAAERAREPFALALCTGTALYVFELVSDRARLRRSAERLRAAADAAYMPHWALMADWFLAFLMLDEGDAMRSVSRMQAGIATSLDQGCILEIPFYLALLAEALLASGRAEEASVVIDEAFERSRRTAERWIEPELYRRRAELRLTASPQDTAGGVGDLMRALETARAMEARFWELRAARDLARLWGERGKRQKAYDLLAPIYGWFTEGFDTADLKEAKALLDALS